MKEIDKTYSIDIEGNVYNNIKDFRLKRSINSTG